ncbi:TIGR02678 family protein [Anaerovibrio lipolyticus]|uniref:TIGR02678 family protein n=1 Tax=Anaerovibrio lipolyticus TaxID=82374 RepID=UPI0026EAFA72|nr:TIGR02678 family protein [Anaerovibrio lipolyticus]MBE6106072.1 TIGR02678 family protein [Anaerovibrio lipolyticus]
MVEASEPEELRRGAQILLENRWVSRREMPDEYLLIRRNEKALRQFFREKCGWPLLVTANFYKLEKIPANPWGFMGIAAMQSIEDYVLLACVMAFLEEYESGGQFLLGDLAEALLAYYPQEAHTPRLNWESYNWRKSLIRVLNFLAEEGIINIVDDESTGFISQGFNADGAIAGEALYEVTNLARYFLRSFPKELSDYVSWQDLLEADYVTDTNEEARSLRHRRNRIYRELLLKPVFYRQGEYEADFAYLRNRQGRLEDIIQDWFGLHLELYQNGVMAVSHEQSTWFNDVFPVRFRGIHDIILHLSHYLRELSPEQVKQPMTINQWQGHLEQLSKNTKAGWTKEYREMSLKRLSERLLEEMTSWGMVKVDEDGLITVQSALFRHEGVYPADYTGKK